MIAGAGFTPDIPLPAIARPGRIKPCPGLAVVIGGLLPRLRRYTNMVTGKRLAPHVPLFAAVVSVNEDRTQQHQRGNQ
jgi:hypothetical protein